MTTLAIRGAHDKIPKVRFVASMNLEQLCKIVDASVVATQTMPDGSSERHGHGHQALLEYCTVCGSRVDSVSTLSIVRISEAFIPPTLVL
ncbi:hypothetical protein PsorP6_019057 [Peronosclerospora sorghi]|nr:hypothetical protein PsorP6_019057 [Peronosclerospora sorghi]